jgi:hypothetical protein
MAPSNSRGRVQLYRVQPSALDGVGRQRHAATALLPNVSLGYGLECFLLTSTKFWDENFDQMLPEHAKSAFR